MNAIAAGMPISRHALRQPAVAALGGAPQRGRRRAADPDRRPRPLHRARAQPDVAHRPGRPVVIGKLVGERRRHQRRSPRRAGAPRRREVDAERLELGLEVAGADAEDDAPAGQRVERRERLRRDQRMAVRRDLDVRQQAHAARRRGEEAERRDRVVPDRRHRRRVRARHARRGRTPRRRRSRCGRRPARRAGSRRCPPRASHGCDEGRALRRRPAAASRRRACRAGTI